MTVNDLRADYGKKFLDIEIQGRAFYYDKYVDFLERSIIHYLSDKFKVEDGRLKEIENDKNNIL